MEILINELKKLEEFPEFKEMIFPLRRLAEAEKARQLKQGTRIKINSIEYSCQYCTRYFNDPEKFFLHLVQVHICPAEEARKQIHEQDNTYETDISILEDLINKYTEVMLDTNQTRDT